ncbi:Sec-independent protein translocase TatB [Marinomonas sp. MED121]|uniref:Sec-independent protein translocase protein TatB n=1 Tax=Marinomonas sp. MED121 TaxID=314277 RepID=UPI0000690130|nr:Sec-independent protein translocase protein TatB [Marinomonas sp. MED121]EAQ65732.1 Sec-independent protein translocase TatB [Marinomonas sp. MED121]
MFDIGFSELLVVFIVGLLILGPERLPQAAKTAGLWIRKIRRSINSVQREINAQLDQEELQRKLDLNNQRIMQDTPPSNSPDVIQNTITPIPENAFKADEAEQEATPDSPSKPQASAQPNETDNKSAIG